MLQPPSCPNDVHGQENSLRRSECYTAPAMGSISLLEGGYVTHTLRSNVGHILSSPMARSEEGRDERWIVDGCPRCSQLSRELKSAVIERRNKVESFGCSSEQGVGLSAT